MIHMTVGEKNISKSILPRQPLSNIEQYICIGHSYAGSDTSHRVAEEFDVLIGKRKASGE